MAQHGTGRDRKAAEGEVVIEVTPAAARELRKLRRHVSDDVMQQIVQAIEALRINPRPRGVEKLADADKVYRITVAGTFRIVYQILDRKLLLIVLRVSDRKEAYRHIFRVIKERLKTVTISP